MSSSLSTASHRNPPSPLETDGKKGTVTPVVVALQPGITVPPRRLGPTNFNRHSV
jgi:hypothetical protein